MLKRNEFMRMVLVLMAVLLLSCAAFAQQAAPQSTAKPYQGPPNKSQPSKDQPFNPHDLNGVWHTRLENPNTGIPPRTPAGDAAYKLNKPAIGPTMVPLVDSNDPVHICDPQGLPRDLINIVRPIQFIQTKDQLVQLFFWNEMWRIIWTDGRSLPADAVQLPRWNGYSVGHWDGDTFVVKTSGLDERSWLDAYGDPHSDTATFEERYHRLDHDTLELQITITDPKMYTKPWVMNKEIFKLEPELDLKLQEICTPSEMANYQKVIVEPEANK
jgi:hypothetical protein